MEYIVNGNKYILSYPELRERYVSFEKMTDDEFKRNLSPIIHFACIVCFLKEIPTYVCLSDEGIIHQLAHLLDIPDEPLININEIRRLFNDELRLS